MSAIFIQIFIRARYFGWNFWHEKVMQANLPFPHKIQKSPKPAQDKEAIFRL
jgi:hypothetical protein